MNQDKIKKFYAKRRIFFAISITFMIIGIIGIFVNGVKMDIKFKGGALIKYSFTGELDEIKAANIATEQLGRTVTSQITTDIYDGDKKLVLNIAGEEGVDANEQKVLDSVLKEAFSDSDLQHLESQMVGKYLSDKYLRNGITAIILATLLVLIYVWIRFKLMGGLSAGVMAVVALIHDVLIVFFTCVIFQIPLGDSFVAVALSIIGYSINDTIVIYDRIRENSKTFEDYPVDTITDLSTSQCFMRSFNTSFTLVLSVIIIYILAFAHDIESIRNFALPMTIGAISGCYSSMCIAGPLWVMWKKRKGEKVLFKEKRKK